MTQSPGALFERLLDIMRRLRGPAGCPWDREQTRISLKPYLIEETYEVLEAIETGAPEALREELGDLLFQVVFHAEIAAERGEFTMAELLGGLVNVARLSSLDAEDVLQAAVEKFRRRFTTMEDDLNASGKSVASVSPEELERSWEAAKAQERSR